MMLHPLQCDFHVAFLAFPLFYPGGRSNWRLHIVLGTNWNEKRWREKELNGKCDWRSPKTSLNSLPSSFVFCIAWQHELAASCQKNCYISCLFLSFLLSCLFRLALLFSSLLCCCWAEFIQLNWTSSALSDRLMAPQFAHDDDLWQHFIFTMATLPPFSLIAMEWRRRVFWD